MFDSVNNKLIVLSNGKPNQRTPLMLINNEINEKISQKGKKRVRHEVLWEKNKPKLLKDSVSYQLN
jgi:hypothetical protein